MTRLINCIRVTHHDNYVWMVSTKDKYYGEVTASKKFREESQEYDLSLSWLIIDIVDANREYLEAELRNSVQYRTVEEKDKFENLDTYGQQLALESLVQQLIGRGAFGHKVFKDFRKQLLDMIKSNEALDRTFETVKIGLMLRYIQDSSKISVTSDNRGYITSAQVKSGEVKLGLTEDEFNNLQTELWFGENLIRNIYSFLLAEYSGKDYLEQVAALEKAVPVVGVKEEKAKKSTKLESENVKEPGTLPYFEDSEDSEKKPVTTL